MGKGGAQLGKAVKGKSKEKKEKKQKVKEIVSEKQLSDGKKQMEEYERLQKLADANKNRLKKLLQQEEKNTKLNRMILINALRQIMRAEKLDSLKVEAEIISQNYEQDLERKNRIIHTLVEDIDQLDKQFQVAQRTHMSKIDKLLQIHNARITGLDSEFETDLKNLKHEFESERQQLLAQHNREVTELKRIYEAVENEDRRRVEETKQGHETEREEIRNKNLEDINMLRINLENKIEDLERQFDDAHQQYVDHTDQSNKHFKKLVKKDKMLNKQIETQRHKIEKLQNRLVSWKKKTVQNEKECQARNQALRQQKDALGRHCQELKQRMKRFRGTESRRLTEIATLSRDTRLKNEEVLSLAERIMKLVELGRKHETEKEKVLPFYHHKTQQSKILSEIESQVASESKQPQGEEKQSDSSKSATGGGIDVSRASVSSKQAQTIEEEGMQRELSAIGNHEELGFFFQKYNKVLLDKLAVAEEKKRLEAENEGLRSILQQYLDGVGVKEDIMDSANPLFIVNGRVNLLPEGTGGSPVRRKPATSVVEASIAVRTYAAHNR